MKLDWLQILAGFGLFLFSLQILTQVLSRSISGRIRPVINRHLASNPRCFFYGFTTTLFVQASSATIIAGMGLLNASITTLEQSYFIMLGATLGTTLKSWFFTINYINYTPVLIGIASISLLFIHKPLFRNLMELVLSIGLVFLGLKLLADGLIPLQEHPYLLNLIKIQDGNTLYAQLLGIFFGFLVTVLLQSSSAFVFLTMSLALQGAISFSSGAALFLGSNIGTTSTPLIAALFFSRAGFRLAFCHFLVKFLGVLFFLFFFSSFLEWVDWLIPGSSQGTDIPFHLAAVHTIFNLFNVILWSLFSPFILWFVLWLFPDPKDSLHTALPPVVLRILISSPQRAIEEAGYQLHHLKLLTKSLTDECITLMFQDSQNQRQKRSLRLALIRAFERTKESLFYLLIKSNQPLIPLELKDKIKETLKQVSDYQILYRYGLEVYDLLEQGLLIEYYQLPEAFRGKILLLQKNVNELWISILAHKETKESIICNIRQDLKEIENYYFEELSKMQTLHHNELMWMYQTLNALRHFLEQTFM